MTEIRLRISRRSLRAGTGPDQRERPDAPQDSGKKLGATPLNIIARARAMVVLSCFRVSHAGETLTMSYRSIPLSDLLVNRANDRHGELADESAAIAWLFNNREQHMKNLAKDLVETGEMFKPPLVSPERDKFIVFDGNRRVTCLK